MYYLQVVVLCVTVVNVIGDLPPGTQRNTYLPPKPTQGGYTYTRPSVPFPTRPSPTYPVPTRPTPPTYPIGPTRPTSPTYPVGPTRPTPPRPTGYPPRPTGYPPRPTVFPPRPTGYPPRPTYIGEPSIVNGNSIGIDHDHHHHHEPGMPFDFNYAVKEDGNDYSHNAISDGDIVRGEYRVQLPDGRTQVVRYTADWQHGFNAQVSYDGNIRYDIPGGY